MTHDEYRKANEAVAILKGLKSDLLARTDLDHYDQAYRDLYVIKLDLALGELEQLKNYDFLEKSQREVDMYKNGEDVKGYSRFDDDDDDEE